MITFTNHSHFKMLTGLFLLLAGFSSYAQNKTIGNKPRTGSSRSSFSVAKGEQTGIRINAGKKPLQLLELSFGTENDCKETPKFKVNIYEFNDVAPGENFVKQEITGVVRKGKGRTIVDLSPYHIVLKGKILVAIEWLESYSDCSPAFFMGIFNGGSYRYTNNKWSKIPVVGFDFNILARKIKKS